MMLQEAFTKFCTGEIFDELEVEGFLRERFTEMQATELVIKNKKLIDNSRQMYQKGKFLRICEQMAAEAAHENELRLAVPSCHGRAMTG